MRKLVDMTVLKGTLGTCIIEMSRFGGVDLIFAGKECHLGSCQVESLAL